MKNVIKIIGLTILGLVYIWLVWGMFAATGFNLKNILIAAMAGIIIFLPLYKKFAR